MSIAFLKYEALGNDFILVDESQDEIHRKEPSISPALARRLCHRKLGIGADGVITLLAPKGEGDVFMHVTNADGSIPENCGNGLRCVARYFRDMGRVTDGQIFVIETLSGPKKAKIDAMLIRVEVGVAKVRVDVDDAKISELCAAFAHRFQTPAPHAIAMVDIGNPHLILECDAIDVAQRELGPRLEKLDLFPNGVNVSFVKKESATTIALRTFERGAGATEACGSGAGASVAAFVATERLGKGSSIAAHFRNGVLSVSARPVGQCSFEVSLSGSAQRIFTGVWEAIGLS